ncbi:MAG TPA: LacI family DNA-binding transcriptional regulator [Fimbriimonadaceae bacterium]
MTIREIAEAVGVSKPAVSKVLHNSSVSIRVSTKRAEEIRRVAAELGYVPNATARQLKGCKTNTVGVYFYDLAGIGAGPLYTTYLLEGVSRVIFRKHYRLALIAELDQMNALNSLSDGRLDGLIWCRMVRDADSLSLLDCSPIPVVALTILPDELAERRGPHKNDRAHFVHCDNQGGIKAAVEHLWSLGHRNIAFLHESTERDASDCVDRLEGYRSALLEHGVTSKEEDVLSWSWELDEFPTWHRDHPEVKAVICWTEACAGRLIQQCAAAGVNVPRDLSVIGFDSTNFCDSIRPRLTAVRQPIMEMASYAAQTLLKLIDGVSTPAIHPIFPCVLDVRESTDRPNISVRESS